MFDDVGRTFVRVTGLRGAAAELGSSLTGSAAEQFQRVLREVGPLLDRADSILNQRIEQSYGRAQQLLATAEAALDRLIDRQVDAAEKILSDARGLLEEADRDIRAYLCSVAPEGTGVRVAVDLPSFLKDSAASEAIVPRPARTKCWHAIPVFSGDPDEITVSGWWFYYGLLCEWEAAANRVDPTRGGSLERLANYYDQLSMIASRASCSVPEAQRASLVSRQADYVRRAKLLREFR